MPGCQTLDARMAHLLKNGLLPASLPLQGVVVVHSKHTYLYDDGADAGQGTTAHAAGKSHAVVPRR